MTNRRKAVAYYREPGANMDAPYATKFAGFIRVLVKAKESGCDMIIIDKPWVIGDTYDEVVENLSHLAGSNIGLHINRDQKAFSSN